MRTELLIILGVVLVILAIVICIKVAKSVISKVVTILIAICLFIGGGQVINLNTLPAEVEQKVQLVADTAGDSLIKTEGNTVYIKIDEEWYDVSKISIIGKATGTITLRYEGKEIYVGESGVVNAIKILEKAGLLKDTNNN